MYCNFFEFSKKPFDVTPDPQFLYMSPEHRESLAALIYGIRERRGFITLVGEVGTGKTLLLNAALERLDEKTKVAFIFNTDLDFEELLNVALMELDLAEPEKPLPKTAALHRLNEFAIKQLSQGGNVVLIVDEAQNLDLRSMENLRLLSNLETPKHKLLQIVLSGQPELDTKLNRHELRQLTQRISLKRYIKPLSEKDTYAYLLHRLAIAGCSDKTIFTTKAKKLIWEHSGGVPRKINIICDNAFLLGYALQSKKIKSGIVQEAIKDLSWTPFSPAESSDQTSADAVKQVQPEPPAQTVSEYHARSEPVQSKKSTLRRAALAACLLLLLAGLAGGGFYILGNRLNLDVKRLLNPIYNLFKTAHSDTAGRIPPAAGETAMAAREAAPREANPAEPPAAATTDQRASDLPAENGPPSNASVRGSSSEHAGEAVRTNRASTSPELQAPSSGKNSVEARRTAIVSDLPIQADASAVKENYASAAQIKKTDSESGSREEKAFDSIREESEQLGQAPHSGSAQTQPPVDAAGPGPQPLKNTPSAYQPKISVAEIVSATTSDQTISGRIVNDPELQKLNPSLAAAETKTYPVPQNNSYSEPSDGRHTTVSARQGDSLSEIIKRAYGKFDEETLRIVMEENPEVFSPDLIFVGQRIRLPRLSSN